MRKTFTLFVALLLGITTMMAAPFRLYVVGSATSTGYDRGTMVMLENMSEGVWEYCGDLSEGDLKFLTTAYDWVPSYGPTADGTVLTEGINEIVYRATYDDDDTKFSVSTAGRYSLVFDVDHLQLTATIVDAGTPSKGISSYYPEAIFPIGDATEAGWTPADAMKVEETAANSGVYTTTISLTTGELKFLCQTGWGKQVVASEVNASITGEGEYAISLNSGSPDTKFKVEAAAEYNVIIDLTSNKLTLAVEPTYPTEMYICGGAVGGFSLGESLLTTQVSEGIYEWTGDMTEDGFKFVTAGFAKSYTSNEIGTTVSTTESYEVMEGGDDDHFWTIQEAGKYTVTFDMVNMTISLVKESGEGIEDLYEEGVEVVEYISILGTELKTAPTSGAYVVKLSNGNAMKLVK